MFENFVRNMDEEELLEILKTSGINTIGPGLLELEETEMFGTQRYKKSIPLREYVEKLLDERNRNKVLTKLEDRFKMKLQKTMNGKRN